MERQRLAGIAGDRHPDKVAIAQNAVRWVELDPSGARQEYPDPSMGRAAAKMAVAAGAVEIAGNEAGCETERARRLHEKDREITAGAAAELERARRLLKAPLVAPHIGESVL